MNEIQSEYVRIAVPDGSSMSAWFSKPAAGETKRGLLVFQEAFGVNPHIRDVTERFAHQGFAAIAPELFHRTAPEHWEGSYTDFNSVAPHMKAVSEGSLDADVRAAYDWLQQNSKAGTNIASTGYCMGGRASFVANSAVPLKAAVSYYGGNIPPLLHRAGKLSGPMLFFWGEQDTHIPIEQRREVADSVRGAGKNYMDVAFSHAGHGFFCEVRQSYQPDAAALSWELVMAFLNRYCR